MALQLGDLAPDFTANSTEGIIEFHKWLGESWCLLFSHPSAFTAVCTTEMVMVSRLKPEFEKRGVKVISLSIDSVESYKTWFKDIRDIGNVTINFPMIADEERKVACLYGMIHPNASQTFTVRALYVIGPDKKIKLIHIYPTTLGRNFHEILRAIDSLQLTANYGVGTPAGWEPGNDCIVNPSIGAAELATRFPKGYREIKPYYRTTPQPDK